MVNIELNDLLIGEVFMIFTSDFKKHIYIIIRISKHKVTIPNSDSSQTKVYETNYFLKELGALKTITLIKLSLS